MADLNKIELIDKNKALEIFCYLNERLKENQLQLDITIYGGVVMTIVYDNRPATKDIDCIFSETNSRLLENILKLTQRTFNLSSDWINEEIKEPLKHILKEDKEIFKVYSNLKILKPTDQLLAMKVLAARAEPAKDFMDANLLCRKINVTTREKLMEIVLKYIPATLIGERQLNFIKYLGEDLGYDWE